MSLSRIAVKPVLRIQVDLNEDDVRDAILSGSHDEVIASILAIDLSIQDAGFTEELVKKLVASLRGDLSPEDFNGLIDDLRKGAP